jgi:glycerophosphoryl diester phosphodiesterase
MELSSLKSSFIPPIVAHRGASAHAPENTLAAFLKAKQLGLKWVEFDTMLAATGEPVVMHDEDLKRTTNGHGNVIDYSYTDLCKLDAGSWFNPKFKNEKISLLNEVLSFLYEHQMAANIEIKPLLGYEQATVQQVFEVLEKSSERLPSPLLISSFSRIALKLARKISSTINLGFLMDEWQADWLDFCKEIGCVSVNVNAQLLNPVRVNAIKENDYLLLVYTVNEINKAEELLAWGVDAIFSDCPWALLSGLNIGVKNGT